MPLWDTGRCTMCRRVEWLRKRRIQTLTARVIRHRLLFRSIWRWAAGRIKASKVFHHHLPLDRYALGSVAPHVDIPFLHLATNSKLFGRWALLRQLTDLLARALLWSHRLSWHI